MWKNFFTTFLVDVRKGGDFYSGFIEPGNNSFSIEDGTFVKLRDVSAGYRILSNSFFREVNVSVSGRNLWIIYSKSNFDVEGSGNPYTLPSGVSLSATLIF
jgi:hypothetical protein